MTHSINASRKRRRLIPKFPFWKDEKVVPGLTAAGALRLFIITIVIAVVVLGLGGLYVLDVQHQFAVTIREGRAARVQEQQRTDALIKANQERDDREIRDLACYAVSVVPPNESLVTDNLRKKYNCPPYKAPIVPSTPTPGATPGAMISILPAPGVQPSAGAVQDVGNSSGMQSGSAQAPGGRAPLTSVASPPSPAPSASVSPRPSRSPVGSTTANPTASASPTPLVNLPSVTCPLVGIFCK